MLRIARLIAAIAVAALALPALAGSWPPILPRSAAPKALQAASGTLAQKNASLDGFEFIGGEAGWQPAQHKMERRSGRWVHSDECDHAIRPAQAAAPQAVEAAQKLYGGG